jgi:hypothetical protein
MLRDAFRARGIRLEKVYTLSSLGILSLLPSDVETIAGEVAEAYEYLRTQKGFGSFTISKQELLLHLNPDVPSWELQIQNTDVLTGMRALQSR